MVKKINVQDLIRKYLVFIYVFVLYLMSTIQLKSLFIKYLAKNCSFTSRYRRDILLKKINVHVRLFET